MPKRFCLITLALLSVFLLPRSSQADEVTAAMRQADPRLQARVTLRSPRILVGELLERLSTQSGVTLAADDWSMAGSDAVTVAFKDVPLSDAMNAVWSLFSYKHMEWDWRRSAVKNTTIKNNAVKGEEGKYTYTLRRPDYARFQAERWKEQVQTDFEAQAQKMLAALDMPPEQLKEAAKQDFLLNSFLADGRVGPGMRILASLPPETLQNIIHNCQGMEIPVAELSPDAQKALQEAWDWEDARGVGRVLPDGKIVPLPRDTHIGIGVQRDPGEFAPTLSIDAGRGSGGYIGGSYLEKPWQQRMNAEWLQPGDAADSSTAMRAPKDLKQTIPADQPHALADYLLRIAEAVKVPLIARIPYSLDAGTPPSTISQVSAHLSSQKSSTKTFQDLLAGVQEQPLHLEHKWRGGVLLLTCQNWFVSESEEARLPWAAVKRLRDAEAAGDGFLSLNDLAHTAAVLNADQMKALGEWFPIMNNAAEWHDFLVFYDKTPEYRPHILSKKGDAFEYPESLVNAQLGIDALRVTHPNLRLQIQQSQQPGEKPPMHQIMFMVREDDGVKPIGGHGFGYTAHEYQSSLTVEEGTHSDGLKASAAK